MAGWAVLTETGLSLGTPHYMSPEKATGDVNVGAATDVYALGCVLYEMLVGEPPYTGSTAQAILGKIIQGQLASATEERTSVPANVDAAIRKALEKLPRIGSHRLRASLGRYRMRASETTHTGRSIPATVRGRSGPLGPDGANRRRVRPDAGGLDPVPVVLSRDSLFTIGGWGVVPSPGSGLHPDGDRFILALDVGTEENAASEPDRIIVVKTGSRS